ncbi:MAG TPA: methyltransferase domain-containing protein [Cyclobacteriaceae bacterium]|jgi:predicted O-methyltransferase YrrM|nr:methyltransferase domain-containing protein [Cytophagales bacterium]HRE65966.1 methyltransferase domain-containing protein [Cyclobacteriaceae bacterium]HRF33938.1 methyltransferase domain-containing protein [Cyclobacteriaceae bacterium]
MWSRIVRKLNFLKLKSGVLPYTRFEGKFARIAAEEIDMASQKLKPFYDDYIAHVSRADMAMSLELASFVYALCVKKEVKNVLDLGSGFSSFVYRLYASEHKGVTVVSVDDDSQWIEKTREYLRKHSLSEAGLLTLKQFLQEPNRKFDCVLHDLNFVEVRINYLQQVLEATAKTGVLILDDVHKPDYLYQVLDKLKKKPVSVYDLKPVTYDSFNRYAVAVLPE